MDDILVQLLVSSLIAGQEKIKNTSVVPEVIYIT